MKTLHTLLALFTAVLLTACANPNAPGAGPMREKMMPGKTPQERQALMDEHMKAMHEGMDMTQRMPGGTMAPAGK